MLCGHHTTLSVAVMFPHGWWREGHSAELGRNPKEMLLEFRSRLEGEGEEQPRVGVESLLRRRDGPKGAQEP